MDRSNRRYPSEIYIAIGRNRYDGEHADEYALAGDVAEAVRAEQQAEIERLRALLPPISKLQRMFTNWKVPSVPRIYTEPMRELFTKAADAGEK